MSKVSIIAAGLDADDDMRLAFDTDQPRVVAEMVDEADLLARAVDRQSDQDSNRLRRPLCGISRSRCRPYLTGAS